jgi:AraC family transcriptional regulator of adaptative response/methylated-DNA-[protein]-cysteine methyltransferase
MQVHTKLTSHAAATLRDPRWQAVVMRDAGADGRFVYAVMTTGVYCRPSCASRLPRPENVTFHVSCAAAEHVGFRACRRCKPAALSPAQSRAQQVVRACRLIEKANAAPRLGTLALGAGMSASHFQRVFKAATGVTPKAYAAAQRARRLRDALAENASVTSAIYAAGYSSSSRVYERADALLGMTPSAYRAGGDASVIRFATAKCALGMILVAASARGICAISLGDDVARLVGALRQRFPRARLAAAKRDFSRVVTQAVRLVENPARGLDLPLDIRGTAFQLRVWQTLQKIPPGTTASYADIAHRVGAPRAVRAVAQACAANPLAVAIPCHRVLRADGQTGGYRWGVPRKQALLKRESTSDG